MKIICDPKNIPKSYHYTPKWDQKGLLNHRKVDLTGLEIYIKEYKSVERARITLKALCELIFSFGFALLQKNVREDVSAVFLGKKILAFKNLDRLWALPGEKLIERSKVKSFLKENIDRYVSNKWFFDTTLYKYFEYIATFYPRLAYPKDYMAWPFRLDELTIPLNDFINTDESIKYFAFPVFYSSHFALVFVDKEKERIEYYDSIINHGNKNDITHKLTEFSKELSKLDKEGKNYKFCYMMKRSIQTDGFNCGPWTLFFLEMRLRNALNFNQMNTAEASATIKLYRKMIFNRIITSRFKYEMQKKELNRSKMIKALPQGVRVAQNVDPSHILR